KIEDAYNGADGQVYASLKDRFDKNDIKTASLKRRIANSVAEMKNTDFKVGEFVKVLGYSTPNDSGGAEYIIENNSGNPRNIDIVLNNGLRAKYSNDNKINPIQFGAKGDGITNDSSVFSKIEGSY